MLKEKLRALNNDDLAAQDGDVHQAWNDGEITFTKSGSLLGHRILHCVSPGLCVKLPREYFPHTTGEHGFCYTTEKGCDIIRDLVKRYGK